ncbi:MAG: hypothetical protein NUV86_09570 [Candidatus Scalindua sp.]|nr:hypothetical protein [Candidatus Scalindua sp.]
MASQWMIDRVKGTSTQGQAPVVSPVQQPIKQPSVAPVRTGYNPVNTFKTNTNTAKRMATAGLGKVGELLNAPQKFVQDKITGGKGYEDFYSNNPIGKGIVRGASNKVVQGILPPASAFSTPKRASLASEFALDPLNLVGAGVVSKLGKVSGASKLATKILPAIKKIPGVEKVRDAVGAFQYGYKVPPKTLRQIESTKTAITKIPEEVVKSVSPLKFGADGKELPKETQKLLGYVRRLMEEAPDRPLRSDELTALKQAEPILKKIFNEFEGVAKQTVKLGGDPKIFEDSLGKYGGKRLFEKTFTSSKGTGKLGLDTSVYKKRKDLSDFKRMKLGEIEEPAYGAALSLTSQKSNIEKLKLFKKIAKDQAVSQQGYEALDDTTRAGLTLIPKDAKYGVLAGSYVPKQVANYINPLVEKGATGAEKYLEAFTKVWKPIKTVGSPAQLGRNMVTSQIQNFLENPSSLAYLPKAIKEKVTGGKFYKALKDTGEIAQTSPSVELGKFVPPELNKLTKGNLLSKAFELFKSPGSAVQNTNETIAKTQSFIARLYDEAGKARITIDEALKNKRLVELARQSAEASGFNYQKVSPLVNKLRKGTVPFITYPTKAAGLTAKTLVKNPERINALVKGENAIQSLTEDTKPDESKMPAYLRQSVRVGSPNEKGVTPYINTKYTYPWGNMSDIVSGEGDFNPFTNIGIAPNPLITEAYSQAFKKDIFGNDIKDPIRHAAETFGPSFVRSGYRAVDAKTKNPSSSTSPTIGTILTKEAGVPLYLYNPVESGKWESYDKKTKLQEINSARRKFIRDYKGKISTEKMNNKMNEYNEMRKKVISSK